MFSAFTIKSNFFPGYFRYYCTDVQLLVFFRKHLETQLPPSIRYCFHLAGQLLVSGLIRRCCATCFFFFFSDYYQMKYFLGAYKAAGIQLPLSRKDSSGCFSQHHAFLSTWSGQQHHFLALGWQHGNTMMHSTDEGLFHSVCPTHVFSFLPVLTCTLSPQ